MSRRRTASIWLAVAGLLLAGLVVLSITTGNYRFLAFAAPVLLFGLGTAIANWVDHSPRL